MTAPVSVYTNAEKDPTVSAALELFARELRERAGAAMERAGRDADLQVAIRSDLPAEAFAIEDSPGEALCVAGGDGRGVLYGLGKLLRTSRLAPGDVRLGRWRGVSAPQRPLRAIYFASHFHNFYHDAPVAEVCRYVQELALWGCNALMVWFDMHHYSGIDDPAAVEMIQRLRAILQAARAVGMAPVLAALANEAYVTSPRELRADWTAGHDGYTHPPGGHYHVEICPSRPGGMDEILRRRAEVLQAFANVGVEYLVIWPYDQGGCTCGRCAPWGANGYLRSAREVANLARRALPNARIVLSTWYFDHFTTGEWEGLARALAAGKADWADYLLADDAGDDFPPYPLEHGVPGDLPMVSFPEISMYRMWPWGGYGANPLPAHLQRIWDSVGDRLAGGFPYSEGIFEDINKAICLQLNWDPGRRVDEIVREYAAYEFSPQVADDVAVAIALMESSMRHRPTPQFRQYLEGAAPTFAPSSIAYDLPAATHPERYFGPLRRADARLPQRARQSWRWRVLWLRAALDVELHASGGRPTQQADEYFAELTRIYHADNAQFCTRPPVFTRHQSSA